MTLRIERAFRVRLSIPAVNEAETVGELFHALRQAKPRGGQACRRTITPAPSLSPVPAATEARTLLEILDWHASRHGDRLHATVLQDDETVLGTLTYSELQQRAQSFAEGLLGRDIEPGDRIALMLPTSTDFFIAFMGILRAGAIPVPIYPPSRLSQIEDHVHRQARILQNAGARMLATVPEVRRLAGLLHHQVDTLDAVESVADLSVASASLPLPASSQGGGRRPDPIHLRKHWRSEGRCADPCQSDRQHSRHG